MQGVHGGEGAAEGLDGGCAGGATVRGCEEERLRREGEGVEEGFAVDALAGAEDGRAGEARGEVVGAAGGGGGQ